MLKLPGLAVPCPAVVSGESLQIYDGRSESRLPFSPVSRLGKGSLAPGDIFPSWQLISLRAVLPDWEVFPPPPSFPAQEGRCKPAPSAPLMCELSIEGKERHTNICPVPLPLLQRCSGCETVYWCSRILCAFGTHGAEITVAANKASDVVFKDEATTCFSSHAHSLSRLSTFAVSEGFLWESEGKKKKKNPVLVWQAAPAPLVVLGGGTVVW